MAASVTVTGGARLHFGFTDPGGSLGRRFGSIGLAIERPEYCIKFVRQPQRVETASCVDQQHDEPAGARLAQFASRIIDYYGYPFSVQIEVEKSLGSHAGLGSGTQLAVAAGVACGQIAGNSVDPFRIAALLGRGLRSSIGAAAFDRGGFIVDGGRADATVLAPVIAHERFPSDWAIVLISDHQHQGLSSDTEMAAFDDLPEFSAVASGEICRLLLLKVLPAVKASDLQPFAAGISRIQEITGDYFCAHQGGNRFTSPRVAKAAEWLVSNGACGKGQSSWGPTGYVFCETSAQAERLAKLARKQSSGDGLEFCVTKGRNYGASVTLNTGDNADDSADD